MKASMKGALLLLLAFLLGGGTGAAAVAAYQARMGGWHFGDRSERFPQVMERIQQRVLKRLTKELDLRPEQQQQIETMLKETRQEFAKLREEMAPRFRDLRLRGRDRIRAALDAGQQAKFDVLEREWAERAERRFGRDTARPEGDRKAP